MKHLGILEKANLILIERKGKYRWNYINPVPIQEIYNRWICNYTAPLSKGMTNFKNKLEEQEK